MTADTVRHLPLDAVYPNPAQPRKHFDQAALGELAGSIARHGVMQPVTVVPTDDGFMLVAGERRWRASNLAERPTIPAIVRDDLDDLTVQLLAGTENMLRADMTYNEEANFIGALADRGMDVDQIAAELGQHPAWVQRRLNILELNADLRGMLDSGVVQIDLAQHAAKLSPAGQQMLATKLGRGELATQAAAKRFCRAVIEAEQTPAMFTVGDGLDDRSADAAQLRDRRDTARRDVDAMWQGLDRAAAALDLIDGGDVVDLAVTLGDQLPVIADQLAALAKRVSRAAERAHTAREYHALHAAQPQLI